MSIHTVLNDTVCSLVALKGEQKVAENSCLDQAIWVIKKFSSWMTDLSSIRVGGGRVSAHPETSKQSSTAHPYRGSFSLESLLAEQMTRAKLSKFGEKLHRFFPVYVSQRFLCCQQHVTGKFAMHTIL